MPEQVHNEQRLQNLAWKIHSECIFQLRAEDPWCLIIFYELRIFCLQVCMSAACVFGSGGKRRVPNPLELKLEMNWSALFVIGTKPGSSTRATRAFSC